jgi:Ca-activated chloride channel homolog
MDSELLIDHHRVDPEGSPNAAPGVIVRALLLLKGHVPEARMRPTVALSLVLDRSGSMMGDRLVAARDAAARVVDRLHPDDVISVVAFDDVVHTIAAPDRRARHTALAAELQAIEVGGSTNLSGGWLRGREHMQHAQGLIGDRPGGSRRIVLLTDGLANVGITDAPTLVEFARTARSMGITTTTVGIGEGYDDHLLRAMADAGGGNAWYIEHPDQSRDVLAEELGNLLSVCAQGVQVSLQLSNAVSLAAAHSDWPSTMQSGITRFDLGDLYAAEPKPLLLELFVPDTQLAIMANASASIATLVVSADVITAAGSVEHRRVHLPVAATLSAQRAVEPRIEQAILLAHAAKAREEAARRQRDGDAYGAAEIMRAARTTLGAAQLSEELSASVQEACDDFAQLEQQYRERTFSELDAKYQMQRSYNAKRGKVAHDQQIRRPPRSSS